ncbi:MAG TPA: DUF3035 domain-containing protein [Rhizomicrobium sp.]|jgi:hypothetical protein|nr:DUF3035 domain-containing protein [Rhizomicrobium sp.]
MIRANRLSQIALLVCAGVAMAGCGAVREAAGISKHSPDEFAIVTKTPLVMPPDYNLRPPKPGAAPTNQQSPTDAAQAALFNNPNAAAAGASGNYSQGEQSLIANAGATNADDSIRRQLMTDNASATGTDESFSNQVMFWQGAPPDPNGTPVNADAEAQRIQAAKANGANPGSALPLPQQQAQQPTQTNTNTQSDDKGGWFDWLF